MTLHDYFLIALAVVTFVIFPIWGVVQAWRYFQLSPKERRQRRDAVRESRGAVAVGSAFGVFDKIIRPSIEHQIEAQEKIVKEDEKDGE
jgi:hypothetical protein